MRRSIIIRFLPLLAIQFLFIVPPSMGQENTVMSHARLNRLEELKAAVGNGADINSRDESNGYTALMYACEYGYVEMGKYLLETGADVNITAIDGTTALVRAAGNTPALVEPLLANGADPGALPENGMGPVTMAVFGVVFKGFDAGLVESLIKAGADVDEAFVTNDDFNGFTPLFWATREGNAGLVALLVKSGANVNTKSDGGLTPLKLAVDGGHDEVAEILRKGGAK